MNRLKSINFDIFKSRTLLLTVGGLVVLLLIWWFAWMSPESSKLNTVNAQAAQLQTTLNSLNQQIAQLEHESATLKKELPLLKRFTVAVPTTSDAPSIVTDLHNLAKSVPKLNLLSVTDNTVVAPTTPGGLYVEPVSFSVSGPHSSVATFLTDFYNFSKMPRLMTIDTLSLQPGGSPSGININNDSDGQTYSVAIAASAYSTGP
jgi:Tfp pilus assembly protein PilO